MSVPPDTTFPVLDLEVCATEPGLRAWGLSRGLHAGLQALSQMSYTSVLDPSP